MQQETSHAIRLAGFLREQVDGFAIDLDGRTISIQAENANRGWIGNLLREASHGIETERIIESQPPDLRDAATELIARLLEDHAIVRSEPDPPMSGLAAVLMLEGTIDRLCSTTLERNPFWNACIAAKNRGDVPDRVVIGMVIENWHFLHREAYFDAPVLGYVPNLAVRQSMNAFFSEEYGHDEILLRSLNAVGISRDEMYDSAPLPATMGLCNALAHWSHYDPMFFFLTMGVLEGQGLRSDSFLDACERMSWPHGFIAPLRAHSMLNIKGEHGNLTRKLFVQMPLLAASEVRRLRGKLSSFVEIYDAFYRQVFSHYSSTSRQLRRISNW